MKLTIIINTSNKHLVDCSRPVQAAVALHGARESILLLPDLDDVNNIQVKDKRGGLIATVTVEGV